MTRCLCRSILPVLTLVAWSPPASAQLLNVITEQAARSQVESGGIVQSRDTASMTNGFASSVAIWPNAAPGPQARSAARSIEVAANASIENPGVSARDFDLVLSQANYTIRMPNGLPHPTDPSFESILPPSFLEIGVNVEFPGDTLSTLILAVIGVCTGKPACETSDEMFRFQAAREGSYADGFEHCAQTRAVAALDTTPLGNPVVTDTQEVITGLPTFQRLVEFPAFTGHVPLGILPTGTELTVEYVMQARASGRVRASHAIAAINDPVSLDGDPVQSGGRVLALPVPEPAPWMTLLAGLGPVAAATRRRPRTRADSRPGPSR